jgi:diguanylate cyclase (GGDEF)-like protein
MNHHDDGNDAEIVRLSGAEATTCILDPERGLTLLRDVLEKRIAQAEYRARCSAFLAVSIDNVQSITELFGDVVAEPVFGGLAARLKECLRTSDVIARMGYAQFGIVLPYFRFNGASVVLKRVLALRAKPVLTHFGAVDLRLSVASVLFPDGHLSASDIITRAQATLSFNQNRREEPLQLTDAVRTRLKTVRSEALSI